MGKQKRKVVENIFKYFSDICTTLHANSLKTVSVLCSVLSCAKCLHDFLNQRPSTDICIHNAGNQDPLPVIHGIETP